MVDIVPGSERDVLIDALVEPPAQPGPLARGFGAGVAGVKSSLYGAGALAARGAANAATAVGATPVATYASGLEQAALTEAQALEEQAAAGSMRVEDVVEDPTRTIEFAEWALGNAAPSLLLMAAGGLAGRGLGALAARSLPVAAKTAKTVGMYAGAVTPDVALEAGGIYPEALRTGVEDPTLRAAVGGTAAGAVDFLTLPPQLRALLSKGAARGAAKTGFGAIAKSAALNAPKVGALEAAQELSQEMIGMAAAGVPLTGTEAMSRYINAAVVGGIAGGAVGGVAGGIHGALGPTTTVQPAPVPMDRGQPPVQEAPTFTGSEQPAVVEQPGSTEQPPLALAPEDRPLELTPVPTAQEEAWNRYNALEDEVVRTGQALREANQQVEASAAGLKALGRRVPPAAKAAHEAVVAQAKAAQLALEELTPRLKAVKLLAETPAALNPAVTDKDTGVVPPSDTIVTTPTPPTEAEQVTRAVEGMHALMREQGLITPAEDTTYQGNYDRIFKKVVEPVTGTARETVRAPDPQAQMKAIEPNAMAVIEPMAKSLAEAKTKTPGGRAKIAKAITASLRGVVQEAAKLDSVDAAQAYILEKTPEALKGHGVLMDAPDIAKAVSVAVGQAKTLYSKGALQIPSDVKALRDAWRALADQGAPAATVEKAFLAYRNALRGYQNKLVNEARASKESRAAPLTQPEYDALPQAAKEAATDTYNRVMMGRGLEARARIRQLLGDDPNLVVKTFQADPGSPIGMYTRVNKYKSVVAMALNAKDILGNADHEGFHYAEDRLLTGAERQIVANALKIGRPIFNQLLARVRQYDVENRTQLADEVASTPAEARAYAFEFWRRGELQADGALARVFQKLQQFFERVANMIRGLGFKSIEDVFVAFDRGQFAERTGREQNGLGEQDRLAARSSDYTNTPEFKRWFGDSKVVDKDGKPLVVYHGTSSSTDFSVFTTEENGAHFGTSAQANSRVGFSPEVLKNTLKYGGAWSYQANRRLVPVYLALKNLKRVPDSGKDWAPVVALAKSQGYDGLVYKNRFEDRGRGESYVAFRPEQIKSAIGNTGAFDPNNPDIRFSNDRASPWYRSALTEAVQAIPSKQASAQGWKEQIKGLVQKGAVKQAEVDAVGLDEFLSLQKGRVTKDQILAFLGENGVRVEEVVLGDTGDWTPADAERLDWLETNRDDLTDEQEAERGVLITRENAQSAPGGAPAITKFAQYQLPGGTNYRELLLTLPSAMKGRRADINAEIGRLNTEWDTAPPARQQQISQRIDDLNYEFQALPSSGVDFLSSHFDQPNILAHIRFNERTDAEGARVLFVEEFQSDWAQKGRKEGFNLLTPAQVERWKELDYIASQERELTRAEMNEYAELDVRYGGRGKGGIPTAPFVTKTEAWLGLSLKRMIRYAAENGFDKVAWTTGEQQVERYTSALRKQVDSIEWKKTPEGVHLVGYKGKLVPTGFEDQVSRRGGPTRVKVVDTTESESALSDAIGKSMADKIKNDPNQTGTIEGENITVSDTGMAGFYDRIVPSVANGILKKLGGGRVGTTNISQDHDASINQPQEWDEAAVREVLRRGGEVYVLDQYRHEEGVVGIPDLETLLAEMGGPPSGYVLGDKQGSYAQPSFTITPALATRAAEGLPLFSRAAQDLGITPAMERQAIVDQTRQFAIGELTAEQYYQSITKLHDLADTRGTPRDLAKGVGADVVSKLWAARMPFATGNYIARFSKGYRNVMEVMLAQIRYKHSLIAEGSEAGLSAWHAGSQEDRDVVTDALIKRTVGGYLVGSAEYNEIRRLLETTGRLAMFDQANTQVERFLKAEFEADKYTFKQLMSEEEYPVWEAARDEQVRNLIANGYIPEKRYGDHTVRIYADTVDKKGPKRVAVGVEHFETKREAVFRAEQIKQELAASGAELFVEVGDRYRAEHDSGISIQQFLDTARRHGVQITRAERERLSRALIAADSVQRNRMMRRRNVPGMSKAGYRIMNEFVVTMANKVAHAKYSSAVNDALEGLPVEITANPEGPATTTVDRSGANFWEQDGPQAGFYRNLADSLADRVLSPTEGSEWSSKFKGLAMGYFLGGSLSAGLVQLFALPMNTLPWLSMHTSYGNAFASSMSALSMTVKNNAALRSLETLQDPTIRLDDIDAVPGLRAALVQAAKDGRTMDTEIFQIMGISRGGMLAQSRTVQKAMQVWMAPFRLGEQTSRIASFIAAYKVGLSNHLSGVELYKFAGSVVDNTQNQFNEVNRPAVATHPIWSLMFMFKSFPLFMVEMIELMYRQNPKSAVYMLLGLVAFTGVQGLPFAEDIEDLVDMISQKLFGSSFNARRAMRNVMKDATEAFVGVDKSELLLRGAFNDLTGVNVASRVGMGDLVPGSRIGSPDTDYSRTVEQLVGAPFAMATAVGANVGKLVGGIAKGDMDQALAALRAGGPSAVRNVIKGVEQLSTGIAEDARGRKLTDVSTWNALLQLGGLTSANLNKLYEMDKIDRQVTAYYTEMRTHMQDELVRAMKDGDKTKAQEVYDAMRTWTDANPDMPLMLNPASIRRQILMAGIPLNQRSLLLMPKQLRGTSIAAEMVQ